MLKFLTHKLRTHSLNEESVSEKVEERDSGTESDDEAERQHDGDYCTDVIMKWNDVTDLSGGPLGVSPEGRGAGVAGGCVCAPHAPAPAPPRADLLYDHHSSEEELEVINAGSAGSARGAGSSSAGGAGGSRRRGASSPPPAQPEKRKWSEAGAQAGAGLGAEGELPRPPSSDDDDTKVETPVRFRTSPPLEALKPRRAMSSLGSTSSLGSVSSLGSLGSGGSLGACGCAPAPQSPRRRRAPPPAQTQRRHRPALDFDKMQQLKVGGGRGVRGAWRGGAGAGGGELSVFCW